MNAFFSGPAFNFHDAWITAQALWHRKRRGFLCEAAVGGKKKDQKKNFSCSRGHLLRLALAGRGPPEGEGGALWGILGGLHRRRLP